MVRTEYNLDIMKVRQYTLIQIELLRKAQSQQIVL